jgi:hypothetical protein
VSPINSFILVQETETKNASYYILLYIFTNSFLHVNHNLKMRLPILIALILTTLAAAGPAVKVDMNAIRQSEELVSEVIILEGETFADNNH